MMIGDTLNTTPATELAKDTVFIAEYIKRNPDYIIQDNTSDMSCLQYLAEQMNDSTVLQIQRKSIFMHTNYYNPNMQLQNREAKPYNNVLFLLFFFIIIFTAVFRKFAGNTIWSFLQSCFSTNQLNIITKNGETVHYLSVLPVVLIFMPLLSVYLCIVTRYYAIPIDEILSYIPISAEREVILFGCAYLGIVILYFFKILLIRLISWIFGSRKTANYYTQMQLNFGNLMAIGLVLPVFCIVYVNKYYAEYFVIIIFLILLVLYITRIIRSFYTILKSNKFSHMYLFFYLCILELVPIILVVKRIFS